MEVGDLTNATEMRKMPAVDDLSYVAGIAQLVRAPDCGSGGRRFETDYSPQFLFLNLAFPISHLGFIESNLFLNLAQGCNHKRAMFIEADP